MDITPGIVARACQCPPRLGEKWAPHLHAAGQMWAIITPAQVAAWLAQLAHESGRLVYVRELWGPTAAQARYEFRRDLGNTQRGDGFRYRGRGLIQVTGRANYCRLRDALRERFHDAPDFELRPELLEDDQWAAQSAGWYWAARGLNRLADAGDFVGITKAINGGTNGLTDRQALWITAKAAVGLA